MTPPRLGSPSPLGVTRDGDTYNFALASRHASAVTLLLYRGVDDREPCYSFPLDHLTDKSGSVWHKRLALADVPDARYYAYRVDGPPGDGNAFNANKVLLDPWARLVAFPHAHTRAANLGDASSAGVAPLGVIPAARPFDWGADRRPAPRAEIVYEAHVKGFTAHETSGVESGKRGTFAGFAAKIPYLRALGVTAVELLPVHQFDPSERNYWGYSTLNFFAPHSRYAVDAAAADVEFRDLVKALHAADLKVILDVVFNHTTEGDYRGPTYSFRGIDNGTYYLLADDLVTYRNDTGCGNVLRSAHPHVRRLVTESLRYWVTEMHVDGFRFDLASIFMRNNDGSLNRDDPPVLAEITNDPTLDGIVLIAEPWGGSYEFGRSFPATMWRQWNDKFRDGVRRFVKGDNGQVGNLMSRLYGSSDVLPDDPADATIYHPYQSVNFVTCHDGFCLYDLVSYNQKTNADGWPDSSSWNCGYEGDAGVPDDVCTLRRRQVKNFCALLLLANGTPMFCAGDEFMNTQRGNNNPYDQDNDTTWLHWDRAEANADVLRFFREMIAFRKRHPSIARPRYWREDVHWYGVTGGPDLADSSHTLAYYLAGAAADDDDLYVMINAYWQPLDFAVQEGTPRDWRCVIDTARATPADIVDEAAAPKLDRPACRVEARSVVVLVRPRG